jgi:hypothetical protein
MIAFVVDLDQPVNIGAILSAGGKPSDVIRNFRVTNPLEIKTTPEYPTPVT